MMRYKLRLIGIPVDGSAKISCNNKSVIDNPSKLNSESNKKA